MIHENDKKALTDIADALADKCSPAERASVGRLLELVYEKGKLRGWQALVDEQVKDLRGERTLDSESNPHG